MIDFPSLIILLFGWKGWIIACIVGSLIGAWITRGHGNGR